MTELEKLEQELLSRMASNPEVYAQEEDICTIDPDTRTITIPVSRRILGVESDESVERLYFQCPKIVGDNIDLSTLSLRINYQNAGREKDQYVVTDMKMDGENIAFSWEIRRKVAKYKGNISFIVCAVKTSGGVIKNEWNTTLNTDCEVLEGLEVDQTGIQEETKDVVEQLLEIMNTSAEEAVRKVTAEGEKQVEAVQEAAQEVAADREQIQKNKADIAELYQIKAPAIICEASGESIVVEDSSENYLNRLNVYGKSEQVQTKGNQLFDASKLPTKSAGGATVTNNGDGSFTVSGSGNLTESYENMFIFSNEETKKLLKSRTIKLDKNVSLNPQFIIGLVPLDSNSFIANKRSDNASNSFDVTENDLSTSRLKLTFYGDVNTPIKTGTIKPMFYQDGDGTWEPFSGGKPSPSPEYPQEIESVGDDGNIGIDVGGGNLLDVRTKTGSNTSGCNLSFDGNGEITINGTPKTNNTDIYLEGEWENNVRLYPFDEISFKVYGATEEEEIFLNFRKSPSKTAGDKILTSDKPITSVMLRLKNGKLYNDFRIKPIVNAGNIPFEWQPYKNPQILTIPTPNGLPGIPVASNGNYTDSSGQQWICDEIDFARGKYVQKVKRYFFDGSEDENWTIMNDPVTSGQKAARISVDDHGEKTEFSKNIICNRFIPQTWGNGVKKYCFIDARTRFVFRDERISEVFEDATKVKEWLSKNNLELLYRLKTPIETDLSVGVIEQYKKLHTNKPSTVVQNDSGTDMKMEYVADTKKFIQNQIAEVIKEQLRTNSLILERTV